MPNRDFKTTPMTTHTIQYGDTAIHYTLIYSHRKTLAIEVYPDLKIQVKAPVGTALPYIERKVKKRATWILRQQRQFEQYLPQLPPRHYVSGETHRYLGRQYRLKVMVSDEKQSVKLTRGFFYITVPTQGDGQLVKRLLTTWYRTQAQRVFRERLNTCFAKVTFLKLAYPDMTIRRMETRWGSCTPKGRIILNLKLIQVPKSYIDYVVMHELCHLKEHNHSPRFYALLNRVMPDWRTKRAQLNLFEVA